MTPSNVPLFISPSCFVPLHLCISIEFFFFSWEQERSGGGRDFDFENLREIFRGGQNTESGGTIPCNEGLGGGHPPFVTF